MADLPKRNYGHAGDRMHADQRRALNTIEGRIDAYTPDDADNWADPPPTSLREAVDRLAAAGNSGTWPA